MNNQKELERNELHKTIWKMADDLRGSVDGWDFKQYVLGLLFYRFISENLTSYLNEEERKAGNLDFDYTKLSDEEAEYGREDTLADKGFYILPSELFCNLRKRASEDKDLNITLGKILDNIENSAKGTASEDDMKGLFDDLDFNSNKLGNNVDDRNTKIIKMLNAIGDLKLGDYKDNTIDTFGDAYEFLISNYAANAGKSGGEFFTPQCVSSLISKLALYEQKSINKVYDPAAGSGSLLLQAKKQLDEHIIEDGFFGQEINHTTYNLARMNMFLHNVNYDKFHIALGDTLTNPQFKDEKPFDAIVSNPPYSINWIGNDDPTLINDERFAPASVLAPKTKADFAFIMHVLSYLSSKGRAAIVCFPGIFYRGGAEQKIRQYLVDNNYVETIISLAPNLFYGTSISVNILVLSKHKTNNKIQFIDASTEDFYKKETNNNVLEPEHISAILGYFANKDDVAYICQSVENEDVAKNDYDLSVSSYVEQKDTREKIDIKVLNEQIKQIVAKQNELRRQIDAIVADLEGVA